MMYNDLLDQRLAEVTLQTNPPFWGAHSTFGDELTRHETAYALTLGVPDGGIERGISAAMAEVARIRRDGFTPAEVARARGTLMQTLQRRFAWRAHHASAQDATQYVESYLTGDPVPDADTLAALARTILPTITPADIARYATTWAPDSCRILVASAPTRAGTPPSANALAAAYDAGRHTVLPAYADAVDSPLVLTSPPARGRIVAERRDPVLGIREWTLSNGIRVIVKPTAFDSGLVLIDGARLGGTSLAPDSTFIAAASASQVVAAGGVGTYDPVSLRKHLAGKRVTLRADIGLYAESIEGSAAPADLETALQLMYLQFTAPRRDTAMFQTVLATTRAQLADAAADPNRVYEDTISATMAQYNARVPFLSESYLDHMNLDQSYDFYRARFGDAAGFTFVIVGAVDPDSLAPLVETYLGELPSSGKPPTFRDVGVTAPSGVIRKTVYQGAEPKSRTDLIFTGSIEDTPQNAARVELVRRIVGLRTLELVRQQLAGAYSPQVTAVVNHVPSPSYALQISFGARPERLAELQRAVLADIERLKTAGPTPSELHAAKEIDRREWETALGTNLFWEHMLASYGARGWPLASILQADQDVQRLSAEDVRMAASEFLCSCHYALFSLYPSAAR
jgi:zinc protease